MGRSVLEQTFDKNFHLDDIILTCCVNFSLKQCGYDYF